MADPRVYTGQKVGKTTRSISTSNTLQAMSSFCKAMNPNNPAATRVGSGLQALVSVSKAIGKGGKLPVSIDNVSSNVKWVLGAVGINTNTLFQPARQSSACGNGRAIVAAGNTAAQGLFDRIKAGNFKINDIPLFKQPLENMYNYSRCNTSFDPEAMMEGELQVSAYAKDLDAALPKYKFMFIVQFTFNAPYVQDTELTRKFAFVVKKSTRPGIKYHTEDVNYYNFRTHVVTKAELEEITMTFYDDGRNSVSSFYSAYTRALSPILNYMSASETFNLEQQGLTSSDGVANSIIRGMQTPVYFNDGNSGSTGALASNNKTIINNVKLFHVYDNGRYVNVYNFYNPRIVSFELDDVDMSVSEVNSVEVKFVYEAMYLDSAQPMSSMSSTIQEITTQGKYPLRHVGAAVDRKQTIYGGNNSKQSKNGCIDDTISAVSNFSLGSIGKMF